MKRSLLIITYSLIVCLLIGSCLTIKNSLKSKVKNPIVDPALPFYVSLAKLAYCPQKTIKNLSCSFCDKLVEYNTYYVHSIKDDLGRRFQLSIIYNDLRAEIVVSFSGPTSEQGEFFNKLYTQGFIAPPELRGVGIETGYWLVYNQFIRPELVSKLQQLKISNRGHYRYIFVGHSFGGSLALLSAYDMVTKGILIPPVVYTYGQLRIGDLNFVNAVNKTLQIVKVVKYNDFLTRIPNCLFINGSYKCSQEPSIFFNQMPGLNTYFSNYYGMSPNPFVGPGNPNLVGAQMRPMMRNSVLNDPLLSGGLLPRRMEAVGVTVSGFPNSGMLAPQPFPSNFAQPLPQPLIPPVKYITPLPAHPIPSPVVQQRLITPSLLTHVGTGIKEEADTISTNQNFVPTQQSNTSNNNNTQQSTNNNSNREISYKKPEINSNYVREVKEGRQNKYVSTLHNRDSSSNLDSRVQADNISQNSNDSKNNSNNSSLDTKTGDLKFTEIKSNTKKENGKVIVEGSTIVGDRTINTLSQTNLLPMAPIIGGPRIPNATAINRGIIKPYPITNMTVSSPYGRVGMMPVEPMGMINPLMTEQLSTFYSQPFGTEYFIGENATGVENCMYANGIPLCERSMIMPVKFSPNNHKFYFKTNVEFCK